MIKVILNEEIKKKIEELYWEDIQNSETGLINILQKDESKELLRKKYQFLYKIFYNSKGNVEKNKVKNFLLANRKKMICYMKKLGELGKKESDNLLKEIFRYDAWSKRKVAYEILREMNVEVCPYCNRQYVHTIKSRKVRSQFDHYYPKSKYPYLALSLYNMVPSCAVCNTAKSSLDTMKYPILYPYEEEFGHENKFVLDDKEVENFVGTWQGFSKDIVVDIDSTQSELGKCVVRQKEELHLKELYNEHRNYIIDIIKSNYINTDIRIKELYNRHSDIFESESEIKGLLYMSKLEKEDWGKRTLAKLTYDIDQQLKKYK